DSVIKKNSTVHSNVNISNCTLGEEVVIWPGVCIGQDGFGFNISQSGDPTKKPQTLRVEVHDHVEIGANCTIDRGSWRQTVIGSNTKLDNMVHIAHNVQIGKGVMIAAQTGIAGRSCDIGDYVLIGGQVGIAQHLKVGSKAKIAARSAVMGNVGDGETVGGSPAVPIR
ncbi:hypothetical protein GUITHDRAFT_75132, partial [Guillardia theta CCMP2712]